MHKTGRGPHWTWAVTVLIMILIAWLSTASLHESIEAAETRPPTPYEQKYASAAGFDSAYETVIGNCSMCHAREPAWDGIRWAPKHVVLETKNDVARYAEQIYLHAGISRAMPPPNAFLMDDAARATIVSWVRGARD